MITPAYVQLMAAYNAEMNRRMYGAAAGLTDEQRNADCGTFFHTIHATFCHLLWADRMWMSRFAGWARPEVGIAGSTSLIPDFETLRAERVRMDADLGAWAATVQDDWLAGEISWYSGAMKADMVRRVAPLVVHLFNHQTHHRGQIHAMLTRFGAATGDTDLPFVL